MTSEIIPTENIMTSEIIPTENIMTSEIIPTENIMATETIMTPEKTIHEILSFEKKIYESMIPEKRLCKKRKYDQQKTSIMPTEQLTTEIIPTENMAIYIDRIHSSHTKHSIEIILDEQRFCSVHKIDFIISDSRVEFTDNKNNKMRDWDCSAIVYLHSWYNNEFATNLRETLNKDSCYMLQIQGEYNETWIIRKLAKQHMPTTNLNLIHNIIHHMNKVSNDINKIKHTINYNKFDDISSNIKHKTNVGNIIDCNISIINAMKNHIIDMTHELLDDLYDDITKSTIDPVIIDKYAIKALLKNPIPTPIFPTKLERSI